MYPMKIISRNTDQTWRENNLLPGKHSMVKKHKTQEMTVHTIWLGHTHEVTVQCNDFMIHTHKTSKLTLIFLGSWLQSQ